MAVSVASYVTPMGGRYLAGVYSVGMALFSDCAFVVMAVYFAWKDNTGDFAVHKDLTQAVTSMARRFKAAIALMLGFYTGQCFFNR